MSGRLWPILLMPTGPTLLIRASMSRESLGQIVEGGATDDVARIMGPAVCLEVSAHDTIEDAFDATADEARAATLAASRSKGSA